MTLPGAMIEVTLLGTGSPIPDPLRAASSTLVRANYRTFLVDCGRGMLHRLAALNLNPSALTALLLTHLHSDHIADPFADLRAASRQHAGRVRTRHRLPIAHHADLTEPPASSARRCSPACLSWPASAVTGSRSRPRSTGWRPTCSSTGRRSCPASLRMTPGFFASPQTTRSPSMATPSSRRPGMPRSRCSTTLCLPPNSPSS